jgi:NAD(P)-dependent dehydrogenase (short-subunit alcohol dehydrogenase family)
MLPLEGKTALVTGATRGTGRAIAIELGAAGATVHITGRSAEGHRSPMNRAETLEETAALVEEAGGRAIATRCDHTDPEQVAALIAGIDHLDVLVNDIWGGDPLTTWGVPFHEHPLDAGMEMQRVGLHTHLITSWHAARLLIAGRGLIVEITDGIRDDYRQNLFYDLAKASVIRIAQAQAADLREHGVTVVAVSPGFLRSEAMLDHFGVREENWRDGIAQDRHFAASETPRFVARGIAALAADPDRFARTGSVVGSWHLGRDYDVRDLDGTRPDWGAWFDREVLGAE